MNVLVYYCLTNMFVYTQGLPWNTEILPKENILFLILLFFSVSHTLYTGTYDT